MSRIDIETNEARQGERVPGMFLVLAASTVMAVVTLGVGVAVITAS